MLYIYCDEKIRIFLPNQNFSMSFYKKPTIKPHFEIAIQIRLKNIFKTPASPNPIHFPLKFSKANNKRGKHTTNLHTKTTKKNHLKVITTLSAKSEQSIIALWTRFNEPEAIIKMNIVFMRHFVAFLSPQ